MHRLIITKCQLTSNNNFKEKTDKYAFAQRFCIFHSQKFSKNPPVSSLLSMVKINKICESKEQKYLQIFFNSFKTSYKLIVPIRRSQFFGLKFSLNKFLKIILVNLSNFK